MRLRGLYAITPDETDSTRLEQSVRILFAAAASAYAALQYRNKVAGEASKAVGDLQKSLTK